MSKKNSPQSLHETPKQTCSLQYLTEGEGGRKFVSNERQHPDIKIYTAKGTLHRECFKLQNSLQMDLCNVPKLPSLSWLLARNAYLNVPSTGIARGKSVMIITG